MNTIPMFITLPFAAQPVPVCPQPTLPSFIFVMTPFNDN